MRLGQSYEANDMPKNESNFDPIPAGWYQVKINSAELKDAKSGGKYINVRYDVVGPTHQGRVVFGMLNIQNPSQKAEEIGRAQLGDLMRAVGLPRVQDTDELIGGDLMIKVSIRKSAEYGDQNQVQGYKAIAGGAMPYPTASVPHNTTAETQNNVPARPPWAKN